MSKQNLNLVKKLGTLLVVGLILLSHSPVTALAADDVTLPENQNPVVENVATNNDQAPAVEESTDSTPAEAVTEEVAPAEEPATDVTDTDAVVEETTNEVTEEATETEATEDVVPAEEPVVVETVETPAPAKSLSSFAISDEFGGGNSSGGGSGGSGNTNPNPINHASAPVVSDEFGGKTTINSNGQGTFTTLPTNNNSSAENDFTTLPNGGCTSGCGGGGGQTTGGQGTFTTLPNGTTSPASAEGSFTTQSGGGGGGGCSSNCGGGGGGGYSLGGGGTIIPTTPLPLPCELYLKKFIRLGAANDPFEVRKLQAFLNVFEGFNLPIDGTYDQEDFDAVVIFQQRYFSAVLTPWGITDSTGYVYITTTLTINQIYCHHTVGNDLDLSHIYPVYGPANEAGVKPVEGLEATTTPTTTPSIQDLPGLFQAAAVGVLNFIKDWWCLIIIILLILLIAYLLDERERLKRALKDQELKIKNGNDSTRLGGTIKIGDVIDESLPIPLLPSEEGEEEWTDLDKTDPDLDPSQEPLTKV